MENIKAKAMEFLIRYDLGTFPIDIMKLNYLETGFKITTYSDAREYIASLGLCRYAKKHKGFTINIDGEKTIILNDNLSFSERNEVAGHEIGHIDLNHTAMYHILGKSNDPKIQNQQEKEAEVFTLALNAPAPVLLQMGLYMPEMISRVTSVSARLADKAALEVLKESTMQRTGIEEKLLITFQRTITEYSVSHAGKETSLPNPSASATVYPPQNPAQPAAPNGRMSLFLFFCTILLTIALALSLKRSAPLVSTAPYIVTPPSVHDPNSSMAQDNVIAFESPIAKHPAALASIPNETAAGTQPAMANIPSAASGLETQIVYVTSGGKKYHLPSCQYIRNKSNVLTLTIENAKDSSLTPCSVCDPDKAFLEESP